MFDRLFYAIEFIVQWFSFATVVDAYEYGLVLRLGKFNRTLSPGLHFIYPFGVDQVFTENVVQETQSVSTQSLTTKDGKNIIISAVLSYRIKDIRKYMLEVEDAAGVLEDSTYGVVAAAVERADWDEIRLPEFTEEVYKAIRQKAFRWGVEVISLQFSDKSLSRTLRLVMDS